MRMLGNIIGIEENSVYVKLLVSLNEVQGLINLYVVMEEPDRIFVGEIVNIKDGVAIINLVGEMIDQRFVFGVIRKPAFSATVKLVSKEKIPLIIGFDQYEEDKDLYLGKSPIYEGIPLGVRINEFFSGHFAIFGSTGSGKSCSVARILQNIFYKDNAIPYKASILIFDAYGEYHTAFKDINQRYPNIQFKAYTTNTKFGDSELLRIPLWLLNVDDLAILLGAEKNTQLPIIEKALKLVSVFGRKEEEVIRHKNDIIARALLDVLSSGRPPGQISDQVRSILSSYNTKELNLETIIYQPGYSRPLKQLLIIDATGKIREMELLITFMSSFLDDSLELDLPDGSYMYGLKDLLDAFNFAFISEGSLLNEHVYDEANVLKVRLQSILNSENRHYFEYPEYVNREEFIRRILTAPDGRKAQIINFNITYVDDRLAKAFTKIFSRLFFDYSKENERAKTLPFHIILEEAHRYVQNDHDVDLLGYNIFDRITKEGRKYGVILGLITQRPSELSETAISQCTNFLIFKMLHPKDIEYIKSMVPNITTEVVKRLRILQPGNCIGFGSAFKVPVLIKLDMPDPAPSSASCDISENWFVKAGE